MKLQVQVVAIADDGTQHTGTVAEIVRTETTLETLGLTLVESKHLLQELQGVMVDQQVSAYLAEQRACPECGTQRRLKEQATGPFHTLFGVVLVPNPRWEQCACQPQPTKTLRPLVQLLPERTSPELLYLETKWASLVSYDLTAKLLHEVLPLDSKHNPVTVRNHLLQTAQRLEQRLGDEQTMFIDGCPAEHARLPIPDGPLSVGLDGAIVRARRGTEGDKTGNLFEIIAGKSILSFRRDEPEGVPPESKCFAFVQGYDTKPKRRLFELLSSQGMQANQQVTFFSDGGDTVRRLPEYLSPNAEHILDWFHLTMRLTVLQQCASGLAPKGGVDQNEPGLERRLESVKHYLWHGNTASALSHLQEIDEWLEGWLYDDDGNRRAHPESDKITRMRKYLHELETYIGNNASSIVNYGERYHHGERISTGFVESTVNQVVSKRMVKKQQMQWTQRGAHLLLQVRVQVLNGDWESTFRVWYPDFRVAETQTAAIPLAA
jgi:hypothetical protein